MAKTSCPWWVSLWSNEKPRSPTNLDRKSIKLWIDTLTKESQNWYRVSCLLMRYNCQLLILSIMVIFLSLTLFQKLQTIILRVTSGTACFFFYAALSLGDKQSFTIKQCRWIYKFELTGAHVGYWVFHLLESSIGIYSVAYHRLRNKSGRLHHQRNGYAVTARYWWLLIKIFILKYQILILGDCKNFCCGT